MTNREPAKGRLLKAAAELFYRNGVAATGIDAITTQAGVAKMSLYNNFSSKSELVTAYLQTRVDAWHGLLGQRLSQASSPRERILAVFDAYADHAAEAYAIGFRGCGLLNAAAELPIGNPGRDIVALQKEEVQTLFLQYLRELCPDSPEVGDVAVHLSFLLEGAMSRAGLDGHDAHLRAARRIAISILDQR